MLKDGFLKMNSFLLSKMLKYAASIILKLSLKTFFEMENSFKQSFPHKLLLFQYRNIYKKMEGGKAFKKHDKVCNLMSITIASLHLCSA